MLYLGLYLCIHICMQLQLVKKAAMNLKEGGQGNMRGFERKEGKGKCN